MPTTVTKSFSWDGAHRLFGYKGLCGHIHGHRWTATLHITGELQSSGMVLDFGVFADVVKVWIDNRLDHALLLCARDPLVKVLADVKGFDEKPLRTLLITGSPTAENIAQLLYKTACRGLLEMSTKLGLPEDRWRLARVDVQESPTAYASYSLDATLKT